MGGGVLGGGTIATANVAALGASSKMQPPAAGGFTVSAAGSAWRDRNIDSIVAIHVVISRDSNARPDAHTLRLRDWSTE